MCGITGIFSFSGPPDAAALPAMLDSIHHRGPDERGTLINGPVAMGMTRLSIIDLAGGSQPMSNEDGRISVIFNGEIYNYRELAAGLRRRGHVLRTESDTEVIAHLYEEHGADCVNHLRGMFAFAVWDGAEQRLMLARDRLGIKPLYYLLQANTLIFGSEIKALLKYPGIQPALDHQALGLYLSLKYVPAPFTIFEDVRSLPPGHLLTVDSAGPQLTQYWDLEFNDEPLGEVLGEAEATDRLLGLLRESIDLHLRADVPFGAFLSGGIDSSLIVALMSQRLDQPVRTFALGFEDAGGEASELPHARTVARAFNTVHSEVLISPKDFIDDAQDVIWHLDQPIADQATVATYRLAQAASREVKMVLTGEGGDELFAGYARYAGEQRFSSVFKALPGPLRKGLWAAGSRLPGQRRAKIALYALSQGAEGARFANWFPLFNDSGLAPVLSRDLRAAIAPDAAAKLFDRHLAEVDATDAVQRMLYVDSKLWLPDFLLLRGDKLTMAHSLEARVPLLDHVVAQFAATRPASEKVRNGSGKYLLKQVARRLLPAQIVDRPKQGFPVPIAQWFRAEARDFITDLLDPTTLRARGLFDETEVSRLMSEHQRGFADHAALLWGLASVEIWQRAFLDGRSQSTTSPTPIRVPVASETIDSSSSPSEVIR